MTRGLFSEILCLRKPALIVPLSKGVVVEEVNLIVGVLFISYNVCTIGFHVLYSFIDVLPHCLALTSIKMVVCISFDAEAEGLNLLFREKTIHLLRLKKVFIFSVGRLCLPPPHISKVDNEEETDVVTEESPAPFILDITLTGLPYLTPACSLTNLLTSYLTTT